MRLTDQHSPEIDEDEECYVGKLLQWEQERKKMIGYALRKPVHGMEGVTCERCRHDPFVMWFVQRFVNQWVMQTPVDPVDA